MNIYPFDEVVQNAQRLINKGGQVYQQFVCEVCGAKQTITIPNVFYTKGSCAECQQVTDIHENGCNFLLVMGLGQRGKNDPVKE